MTVDASQMRLLGLVSRFNYSLHSNVPDMLIKRRCRKDRFRPCRSPMLTVVHAYFFQLVENRKSRDFHLENNSKQPLSVTRGINSLAVCDSWQCDLNCLIQILKCNFSLPDDCLWIACKFNWRRSSHGWLIRWWRINGMQWKTKIELKYEIDVRNTFQKCRQLCEQRVKSPVFRKMRCTDGVHSLRSEDILPRMFDLGLFVCAQRFLNVTKLVFWNVLIVLGPFLNNHNPENEPNAPNRTCRSEA